jgi:Tol biopolymer transport system component
MNSNRQSFLPIKLFNQLSRKLSRGAVMCLILLTLTAPAQAALVNQKLSGKMPSFGDVINNRPFQISPDGTAVVYVADQETESAFELWQVPIDGSSPPLRLSGLLPSEKGIEEFAISPDSSRVIYTAEQDTSGVVELYSVPLNGGTITKLNSPLITDWDVADFQISPDSSRVVYRAGYEDKFNSVFNLYSVPLAGGTVTKLNSDITPIGGGVFEFEISSDSSRVVYQGDQQTDEVFELY